MIREVMGEQIDIHGGGRWVGGTADCLAHQDCLCSLALHAGE